MRILRRGQRVSYYYLMFNQCWMRSQLTSRIFSSGTSCLTSLGTCLRQGSIPKRRAGVGAADEEETGSSGGSVPGCCILHIHAVLDNRTSLLSWSSKQLFTATAVMWWIIFTKHTIMISHQTLIVRVMNYRSYRLSLWLFFFKCTGHYRWKSRI